MKYYFLSAIFLIIFVSLLSLSLSRISNEKKKRDNQLIELLKEVSNKYDLSTKYYQMATFEIKRRNKLKSDTLAYLAAKWEMVADSLNVEAGKIK